MRGRTNVAGKPEEERTVTAGTSAVTVEPTKGKTMKKVTVDPTPSQTKTVTAGTGNVDVSPDSGKLLSGVTVKPTPTQRKTVTPTTSEQTVVPDSGKHLSKVTVNAKPSIKIDDEEVDKTLNLKTISALFKKPSLPFALASDCGGLVKAGEIYIYYTDKIYKWTGETLEEFCAAPHANSSGKSGFANFQGKLHIIGGESHLSEIYRCNDDKTWTSLQVLPYSFKNGAVIEMEDELDLLGGDYSQKGFYKFDGETWTQMGQLPVMFAGKRAIKYNGKISILSENRYELDGTTWETKEAPPFTAIEALTVDGKINILNAGRHAIFDGTAWETQNPLLTVLYKVAIEFESVLNLIGAIPNSNSSSLYSYADWYQFNKKVYTEV